MQDWSHIPIHIRCTERYKIDPQYPMDDAQWWKLQETAAKREKIDTGLYAKIPDIVAEWYISQPAYQRVSSGDLATHYGMSELQFQGAIKNYRRYGTLQRTHSAFYMGEMSPAEEAKDPWLSKTSTCPTT